MFPRYTQMNLFISLTYWVLGGAVITNTLSQRTQYAQSVYFVKFQFVTHSGSKFEASMSGKNLTGAGLSGVYANDIFFRIKQITFCPQCQIKDAPCL